MDYHQRLKTLGAEFEYKDGMIELFDMGFQEYDTNINACFEFNGNINAIANILSMLEQ